MGDPLPGLCVLVTVLALNVLSEGMTDAAASPDRSRTGGTDSDDDLAAASAPVADEAVVDAALTELATRLEAMEPAVPPLAEDAPELLVVRDLSIRFPDRYGDTRVVDGISFTVREGETLGLVGESGCGKSITSLAIMGLLARNAEAEGEIRYRGRDLLKLPPKERRALMGRRSPWSTRTPCRP